jgi:hypothetical protein
MSHVRWDTRTETSVSACDNALVCFVSMSAVEIGTAKLRESNVRPGTGGFRGLGSLRCTTSQRLQGKMG